MKQTYNIQFEGYWLEKNKAGIPAKSGVYMVYRSKYDVASDTVTLLEIIKAAGRLNLNIGECYFAN